MVEEVEVAEEEVFMPKNDDNFEAVEVDPEFDPEVECECELLLPECWGGRAVPLIGFNTPVEP